MRRYARTDRKDPFANIIKAAIVRADCRNFPLLFLFTCVAVIDIVMRLLQAMSMKERTEAISHVSTS
jgi:hypothetical protein